MDKNLYEAMFIIGAGKGGSEFPDVVQHIAGLLTRHEAEIERIERWDERKFSFPIKRAKRGIYVLVYFRADGDVIAEMRRLIGLSEQILRVLIVRSDVVAEPRGALYSPEGEQTAEAPRPKSMEMPLVNEAATRSTRPVAPKSAASDGND
jgi:small subunit ribosomal protein S6